MYEKRWASGLLNTVDYLIFWKFTYVIVSTVNPLRSLIFLFWLSSVLLNLQLHHQCCPKIMNFVSLFNPLFFLCRISARKPEWARQANLVCSGSQPISEHRIHFILPTGTASYIITTIISHTFASGKKSANELHFFTFITFMEKDNEW